MRTISMVGWIGEPQGSPFVLSGTSNPVQLTTQYWVVITLSMAGGEGRNMDITTGITGDKKEFGLLIDFMNQSDIPFFIRDIESRFMYANKSCLYLLNITSNINVEGKLDEDLPVDWAEFSNDFKKQDRLTEYNGKSTSIITTQRYNFKADLQSYFSPKTPLYSKGECIGTVGFANKLKFISIPDFIEGKNPFVLSSSPPNKIFTDRELDIIFFSMQQSYCERNFKKIRRVS